MKIDLIFHLAAQTSVLESITNPYKTWESNFFGTYNLLKTIQTSKKVVPIIVATTDKVYKNSNNRIPFDESFQIEGLEPYSQSKATIELLIQSFRHSKTKNIYEKVATARAGNVIGGGDWTENRIVPDIYRSFKNGNNLFIRNPKSIRPWQHVLDPLTGYLMLGIYLQNSEPVLNHSFNFGPKLEDQISVEQLVLYFDAEMEGKLRIICDNSLKKEHAEADFLQLDSNLAHKKLCFEPKLNIMEAVQFTNDWYQKDFAKENMHKFTLAQIESYFEK